MTRRRLRFWGPDVDADVDDELLFHLDACARDLEALGLSPDEAREEALRRFGEVAPVAAWLRQHDHLRLRREARVEYMETLLQDFRLGVRKFWQQPGFSLAVILVLGLGIGAATTMFSAVDAALLRPLPFQRDDRLATVHNVYLPFALSHGSTSAKLDDARALDAFESVSAYAPGELNLGGGGAPVRIPVGVVTPDLFATLGVAPAAGRDFTAEEGAPGGADVAIISDGVWREHFGAARAALEQDVILNGRPYRVVGIMPKGFAFPKDAKVWIPLRLPYGFADLEPFRQFMPSVNVARLAPGVDIEEARAQVLALVKAATPPERQFTATAETVVRPLRDMLVGNRRTALLVLLGATVLVLLVACANVTNLLLSRAAARRSEVAIRAALGASRGRILRQLLVESLLLALAGGAVGIALAALAMQALSSVMPAALAGLSTARLDLRVLGFSVAVAVATGLAFGIWPAFGATRTDASEVIKSGGMRAGTAREGTRLRRIFVVAELAISLMLAVGAGLMLRSMQTLLANDPGVVAENVATLELALNRGTYREIPRRRAFVDEVLTRLEATPGVEAAAFLNELPLRGSSSVSLLVYPEGTEPSENPEENIFALIQSVSPRYFEAMGIPLLAGRLPRFQVDTAAMREMAISETLARQFWRGESPVGRTMVVADEKRLVVGLVGSVRAYSLADTLGSQMYWPLEESPAYNLALVARGTIPTPQLGRVLRDAVIATDPQQAVYNIRPMEEVISSALAPQRVNAILITSFSMVALLLAAVGVYGVIAYGVTRRTREIGIRIALGANASDVVHLVMREGLALAIVGVGLGLAGAWALRRVVQSMLYGVGTGDPAAFAAAAVLLMSIAVLATLIPSRRATRVDPVRAIRVE